MEILQLPKSVKLFKHNHAIKKRIPEIALTNI